MKKSRSFLKWPGNKYRCLEHILPVFPQGSRLIEPFAGSAVVFLNAPYQHYLIAESNPDLVALYQHVKSDGIPFINACETFFNTSNNQADKYYQFRHEFNQTTHTRQRAMLFLYLNRHGYNGLCRYNQQGIYNVPFGAYKKPYFPRAEMLSFMTKSQYAEIICSDFRQTFDMAKAGDVIYCDPPYAPIQQTSNFSAYTSRTFGQQEQIELARLAVKHANHGSTIIISNHDNEFTRHCYQKATIHSFSVKRSISCKAANRTYVKELLAVFHPSIK